MFSNAGKKIKIFAILLCIMGILVAGYIGVTQYILSYDVDKMIIGAVIIVCGAILSWMLAVMVFGFGTIVENAEKVDEIKDILVDIREKKIEVNVPAEKHSSPSILASSVNNEVYDDRSFSATAEKTPEYVQPIVSPNAVDARFVAPTYSGRGRAVVRRGGDDESRAWPRSATIYTEDVEEQLVSPSHNNSAVVAEILSAQAENNAERTPAAEPVKEEIKKEEIKQEPVSQEIVSRQVVKQEEVKKVEASSITSAFEEPDFSAAPAPTFGAFGTPSFKPSSFDNAGSNAVATEIKAASPVASPVAAPATSPVAAPAASPVAAPVADEPAYSAPAQNFFEEPTEEPMAVVEEETVKAPTAATDPARCAQIEELIYKFVARRNGKVNINDILRTVPRNIDPSEFSFAVKKLEEEGRLEKNEAGEFFAL